MIFILFFCNFDRENRNKYGENKIMTGATEPRIFFIVKRVGGKAASDAAAALETPWALYAPSKKKWCPKPESNQHSLTGNRF